MHGVNLGITSSLIPTLLCLGMIVWNEGTVYLRVSVLSKMFNDLATLYCVNSRLYIQLPYYS